MRVNNDCEATLYSEWVAMCQQHSRDCEWISPISADVCRYLVPISLVVISCQNHFCECDQVSWLRSVVVWHTYIAIHTRALHNCVLQCMSVSHCNIEYLIIHDVHLLE